MMHLKCSFSSLCGRTLRIPQTRFVQLPSCTKHPLLQVERGPYLTGTLSGKVFRSGIQKWRVCATTPVTMDFEEKYLESLKAMFASADADGSGEIDFEELRNLLESMNKGKETAGMHWLSDEEVSEVLQTYDTDKNGSISFDEFVKLAQDGQLLDGKLEEYQEAFRAVDKGGNGTIGATELAELFQALDQPMEYERLVQIMAKYDVDHSGQIEFGEFLRMFREDLLDLKDILNYIKLNPGSTEAAMAAGAVGPLITLPEDEVQLLFSEAELDDILAKESSRLVVLMMTLSWCRPCKGLQRPYQKLSEYYSEGALFLKLYGNSNDNTKNLFKNRFEVKVTPTFFFFKDGELVYRSTGANRARLEGIIRILLGYKGLPTSDSVLYTLGDTPEDAKIKAQLELLESQFKP